MTGLVPAEAIEQTLVGGDLSKLRPEERVAYYRSVCESLGLNPLTKPFDYLTLNGKTVLYAKRDCADQLRKSHGVSITITSRETVGDAYVVTARAKTADGRTDESVGAVSLTGLKGEAYCNALMKAETKAKRRVTLSICGLGFADESEIETIPNARREVVDMETGEIVQVPARAELPPPSAQQDEIEQLKADIAGCADASSLSVIGAKIAKCRMTQTQRHFLKIEYGKKLDEFKAKRAEAQDGM